MSKCQKILFCVALLLPLSMSGVWGQKDSFSPLKAYVFLSDECPMCQGYAPVLNQMVLDFAPKGVEIIGIFPNFYATDSAIIAFKKEYAVSFKCQRDEGFVLTDRLKARVTPQIFIVKNDTTVLYSGQIDDAYFRAGKRRGTTTKHYARDVFNAFFQHQKDPLSIQTPQMPFSPTTPIGCVIVRD